MSTPNKPHLFRLLVCIREQVNTVRWENGRPVKYPEVAVHFSPIIHELTKKPWTLLAPDGESALEEAKAHFQNSPLQYSLAVEPA